VAERQQAVNPINRLKALANRAKHKAFIKKTG